MEIKRVALPVWLASTRQDARSEHVTGEADARRFETLYRRHYPGILTFLCFLVGNQAVAEDLSSQVFEKALLQIGNVQIETAGPWLYRVARNCAVDYFRRAKTTVSLDNVLLEEHPRTASLEEVAIANEEQRYLLKHLTFLSEREREVIGLKFVAGLHNREIARVLSVPEGTVSSLLYRALRRLRAALGEDEDNHEEGGEK